MIIAVSYCGLDGRASFENALVMRVDFVVPRARKERKSEGHLVACCTPCTPSRARAIYSNFDEAKAFVLKQREELRKNGNQNGAAVAEGSKSIDDAICPGVYACEAHAGASPTTRSVAPRDRRWRCPAVLCPGVSLRGPALCSLAIALAEIKRMHGQ